MVCVTVFSHKYIPLADNMISFSDPRLGKHDSQLALLLSGTSTVKTQKQPSKSSMASVTKITSSLLNGVGTWTLFC